MNGDDVRISPVGSPRLGPAGENDEPSSPVAEVKPQPVVPVVDDATTRQVEEVLNSDIGVNTLLNRLKQSIASARDFAAFLKKRSAIEDEHAKELRKLCRITKEGTQKGESRGGSYGLQFNEVMQVHERMAENGAQFALSLHQMHEDLTELSQNMENGRKQWKHQGLAAEARVQEAEKQMEKAKSKYDSLAEDYDGVRTGDKKVGRGLKGLRGPKNEDDLQNRVQQADGDYAQKVQHAKNQRQELVTMLRPQAIKAIQDLITECDSALTLQLQKFASFNEKLALGNGLLLTPLEDPNNTGVKPQSLRDVVKQIDNDSDTRSFVRGFHSKIPPRAAEIRYEQHPALAPVKRAPTNPQPIPQVQQAEPLPPQPIPVQQPMPQQVQAPMSSFSGPPQIPELPVHSNDGPPMPYSQGPNAGAPPSRFPMEAQPSGLPQSASGGPGPGSYIAYNGQQQYAQDRGYGPPPQQYPSANVPPQPYSTPPQHQAQYSAYESSSPRLGSGDRDALGSRGAAGNRPAKPVFGISLYDLFLRDQTPVPKIVLECMQAVEMFGLDVEGIYRVSGTAAHIQQLRRMFDNDSESLDFRDPETFSHDINSVAGLLKQFLRDLPDPLMTNESYGRFIEAVRMDDPIAKRDSIHAVINDLPDPNYATLRALVLHLHRVQERSDRNKMSSSNLAICFAPTVMGAHKGPMADAGLQAQVVDTILTHTLQIFDED